MQIKFSSKYIVITFENNERFSGKSVRMKGEPLVNGFDADLHTAEWLENHIGSPLTCDDLITLKTLVKQNNKTDSFAVSFMGE